MFKILAIELLQLYKTELNGIFAYNQYNHYNPMMRIDFTSLYLILKLDFY